MRQENTKFKVWPQEKDNSEFEATSMLQAQEGMTAFKRVATVIHNPNHVKNKIVHHSHFTSLTAQLKTISHGGRKERPSFGNSTDNRLFLLTIFKDDKQVGIASNPILQFAMEGQSSVLTFVTFELTSICLASSSIIGESSGTDHTMGPRIQPAQGIPIRAPLTSMLHPLQKPLQFHFQFNYFSLGKVRGGNGEGFEKRAAMRRIGLLALDWVCGDRERWGIDDIWSLPEKW
ncbi:hypothetical protein D5086_003470 [Populus alba]|uniref:Uncharacterized protein n=1 Tax=Populus alba TaxID=43335 RepID=A0ACC4D622_POPAL